MGERGKEFPFPPFLFLHFPVVHGPTPCALAHSRPGDPRCRQEGLGTIRWDIVRSAFRPLSRWQPNGSLPCAYY